jgi:hypothetical protein
MTQTIRFIKPSDLRSTARGLAVMSLLFDPERRSKFWSDPALSADLATWRDGKGSSCGMVFLPRATVLLGGDRESPMCPIARPEDPQYWPGIFDDLPAELRDLLNRQPLAESYPMEETTFCLWNMGKGLDWKKGRIEYPRREPPGDPDGSKYSLGKLKEYFDHFDHEMDDEFDQSFDADTLYQVFSGETVSAEDLRRLKSGVDIAEIRDALKEMGIRV